MTIYGSSTDMPSIDTDTRASTSEPSRVITHFSVRSHDAECPVPVKLVQLSILVEVAVVQHHCPVHVPPVVLPHNEILVETEPDFWMGGERGVGYGGRRDGRKVRGVGGVGGGGGGDSDSGRSLRVMVGREVGEQWESRKE